MFPYLIAGTVRREKALTSGSASRPEFVRFTALSDPAGKTGIFAGLALLIIIAARASVRLLRRLISE
jgi:hypothetical protein